MAVFRAVPNLQSKARFSRIVPHTSRTSLQKNEAFIKDFAILFLKGGGSQFLEQ